MEAGPLPLFLQGALPLFEQPLLQDHPRLPSSGAQRFLSLPEPAVAMAGHKCLEKMLSGQKEINHVGCCLVEAPTPEVLADYKRSGLRPPGALVQFTMAPHEPNAESLLHAMFALHCEELAASSFFTRLRLLRQWF